MVRKEMEGGGDNEKSGEVWAKIWSEWGQSWTVSTPPAAQVGLSAQK